MLNTNASGVGVLTYDRPFASANNAVHVFDASNIHPTTGVAVLGKTFTINTGSNGPVSAYITCRYSDNGAVAASTAMLVGYTAFGLRAPD